MWMHGWRDQAARRLGEPWDLVVVGGGITGAGILLEAAQRGLKALLLEQRDFAWGASSRSSKLVHGGLRYLKQGKLRLTAAAARERQRLLVEAPGLVEPLGFLCPTQPGGARDRVLLTLGLSVYDHLGGAGRHSYLANGAFRSQAPHLVSTVTGGHHFQDAHTDDARLTLRLLQEARADGAEAMNAVTVVGLLRAAGRVAGVVARDAVTGRSHQVPARAVVNAAGPWSDRLREPLGATARIRPLRGSHLVFPAWRLPVAQALTVFHPADRRPVVIAPWEGATLVGTTDLDHRQPLDQEPRISVQELTYLMELVRAWFPSLDLGPDDLVSTFAGVRPVVGSTHRDPTCESRDHVVWNESGLLTVTGGKLTTFRLIAQDALRALGRTVGGVASGAARPLFRPPGAVEPLAALPTPVRDRLLARYGPDAASVAVASPPEELVVIPGTHTLWAELRWAARAEAVNHLDDLLLRRVRLGLLLPTGGLRWAQRIRAICQPELGWDDARWTREEAAYRELWRTAYAPPGLKAESQV